MRSPERTGLATLDASAGTLPSDSEDPDIVPRKDGSWLIDGLTLEKVDMGAKLQGIEEYCEQEKTKVQHMIDCLETGDDFCAVDKGRVEAYTDILSRLKEER
jgi:hypothetical protein